MLCKHNLGAGVVWDGEKNAVCFDFGVFVESDLDLFDCHFDRFSHLCE